MTQRKSLCVKVEKNRNFSTQILRIGPPPSHPPKKRKYLGGGGGGGGDGMLPRKILKVETKICAVWGILEANLKKSSTLKFIMNISFQTSICIYRSIILIFTGKKVCLRIFSNGKYLFPRFSIFISVRILVSATKLANIKIIWSKLETKE